MPRGKQPCVVCNKMIAYDELNFDGDDSKGVCDDCEGDEVWGSEESNSPEISVAPASVPPAAPAASAPAVDEVMSDDSDSNDSDLIKECGQCGFQYKNPIRRKFLPDGYCYYCKVKDVPDTAQPSASDASVPNVSVLTKRIGVLEKDYRGLEARCEQLMQELEKLKAYPVGSAAVSQGMGDAVCRVCKLSVATNVYCGISGTRHISSAECRERVNDVRRRFPFHDAVLSEKVEVACVMHFYAFYDTMGASRDAKEAAAEWLHTHLNTLMDSSKRYPHESLASAQLTPYNALFSYYCSTSEAQARLHHVGG